MNEWTNIWTKAICSSKFNDSWGIKSYLPWKLTWVRAASLYLLKLAPADFGAFPCESLLPCAVPLLALTTYLWKVLWATRLPLKTFRPVRKHNIYCTSRKHTFIILTPLKPHFYLVKLGFTGVYIIFLISDQKHRLWVLVRTASARQFLWVPTIYVLSRNMKDIRNFLSENSQILEMKFSIYLNRRVFVMKLLNKMVHYKKTV